MAVEALIVATITGAQRGISLCQALLRAQLGQRVNVMILEKAITLELAQFEDSEFYDKLTRARREASSRPLSLVNSHIWSGPEPDLARQLRCTTGAVLTMGSVDPGTGRSAFICRGNTFFGSGFHAVPLAFTRDPYADIS